MDTTRKQRTRRTVSQALHSLMLEKPYSGITVQDVLGRAAVSRSTFYSHFDGKDDLLSSYHAYFWDHVAQACMHRHGESIRVAPVTAILTHLQEPNYRHFYGALMRTGKMPMLRAMTVERLAPKFETELLRLSRGRNIRVPARLAARFIVTTLLDLIDWWVENDSPYPPAEMEAIFHRLVEPSIDFLPSRTR